MNPRSALIAGFALLLATLGCVRETAPRRAPAVQASASSSYRMSLIPQESENIPGRHHELRFRIIDEHEQVFDAFRVIDEVPIRLRVVRRDLGTSRSYVPRFEESTRKWIVPIDFEVEGPHELIAEFVPDVAGALPVTARRSVVVGNP